MHFAIDMIDTSPLFTYITFILPRIYKSSCIANFSEKEKK